MNTPTTATMTECNMAFATSADRYARLVELTCKLTGLQSIPDGYDPWKGLVHTWRFFYSHLQCEDILFATLHSLKWGVYPASEDEPLRWAFNKGTPLEQDTAELMALFREELISPEAEGAIELHAWGGFKGTYHRISYKDESDIDAGPESHSLVHCEFLNSRFDYLVHSFDPTDCRWTSYKEFEKIMQVLLPSSSAWTDANWLDERFILQALDQEFGTNLQKNPTALTPVTEVATAAMKNYVPGGHILANLADFPYALAKHLWPVNTTDWIVRAYNATIRVARENENRAKRRKSKQLESYEFGYSKVKTTGIHRLVRDLTSLGVITDLSMKKQVTDMEFCH